MLNAGFAGTHHFKASVLILMPDIHGYRRVFQQGSAGEGDIRLDIGALPFLQECSHRLEEQRAPQPLAQQVFSKS